MLCCAVQLAKAEKLKPLEVELRRLEDLSKSIVDDFAYMRAREEEMRDTNGRFGSFSNHALTPNPTSCGCVCRRPTNLPRPLLV